ncbi:hypothetical protein DVH24_016776 [Malus domestica]|uniref:TIR domain-containing protein n=1 Tax=Malus domestica TaxID=3750 RepID=A0A498HUL4_MALDO|nr:hypothetical protein DVH24_016776 [Malus domestica]
MSTEQQNASSSSYRCTYDAFLSFRGTDTRKGFTDHLYSALELAGIHTFRDDDEIERGANIEHELQTAIQESRVSIIVFSKDYASSRWCLNELAIIMERKRTDGHMVMPVFYDVEPSDVRKQMGGFAESFTRHEERFKDEIDKVEEWRRALRDVADLGGMVLRDRYESQFIQDIVEAIGNKLDYMTNSRLRVDPYVIGRGYYVESLNMWLEDGSNDVGVAVIHGMGGIGKATIAKIAYNQNFYKFQASSFLSDIRETSRQANGFVHLQRNLLSDIQKRKMNKVYNLDEGIVKIKRVVRCKRVLIVLDDVDNSEQFNAILGMRDWFHPGSKIIITTRHEHLTIKGLMLNFPSTKSSPILNEEGFETKAFTEMLNLELLLLDNVKLSGSYEDFPKNLIWLSWRGFSLKSIPANFCLENLVVLDLRKSSLQHVWKGTRVLVDVGMAGKDSSINEFLSGNLSYCNVSEVPNDLCTLSSLKHLNLIGNPILCLPQKMKSLIMLETLLLDNCTNLEIIPELPPRLKRLEAKYCTSLKRLTNLPNLFRSLESLFWGCEHLVEVESMLNIKPLRSADIEMTRYMGLFNLKSISSTDVEMINYLTFTTRKAPVQVLYECGIYSIFFHGSKIPDGFSFTTRYRSVLSVIAPSHPNPKIRGLNSCVLYAREPGLVIDDYLVSAMHLIKVSNQTKGLMWTYSPVTVGFPTEKEDMLWLSHFRFGNNELDYGDEIRVSVEMHDFRIKEFGIQLVYERERSSSSQNNVAGDGSMSTSEYQMWTGKYFLSNHRHRTHQAQFRKRQENPAHIEFSFGPERLGHKLFKAQGPLEIIGRGCSADSPSAYRNLFWGNKCFSYNKPD